MSPRRRNFFFAPTVLGALLLAVVIIGVTVASAARTASGPTNTARPSIVGTAKQGETLTASNGTWSGSGTITYSYQWQRCDKNGQSCQNISSAKNNQYQLVKDDVGKTIAVAVTATDSNGSSTAYSSTVGPVAPTGDAPANTAAPQITGTPKVGQTLTVSTGTWTGSTPISYSYQWNSCDNQGNNCQNIANATAVTYVPVPADVGHKLVAAVKASNDFGSNTAKSSPTDLVAALLAPGQTIPVTDVSLPNLLVVARVSFTPRVVRGKTPFSAQFKVTDIDNHPVSGALVLATGLPNGWVTQQPEATTDSVGVATISFTFTRRYKAQRGSVTFFVRARKPGDDLLKGVTGRRLVQVTTTAR
jgi:hypothetical protein